LQRLLGRSIRDLPDFIGQGVNASILDRGDGPKRVGNPQAFIREAAHYWQDEFHGFVGTFNDL
jgi:hypothetical protein